MGTMRDFPGYWAAIAGCVMVGAALAWQSHSQRLQAGRLQQQLASAQRGWRDAEAQALLVAPRCRDRAEDLEREHQTRRSLVSALVRGEMTLLAGASMPGGRTEACAALTAMALELRELATKRGIGVSPEENFGFGQFAQAGPEPAHMPTVHRESLIVAAAVRMLIAAQPVAIRGVQREPAGRPLDWTAGATGLAAHGTVRLEFSGHTGVLRDFLNGLARSELPFRVRGVAAAPDEQAVNAAGGAGSPLIASEPKRFAVSLECVQLEPGMIAEATNGGSPAAVPPEPMVWPALPLLMAEARHCDLFTAPTVNYDALSGKFALRRLGEGSALPNAEITAPDRGPEFQIQLYRVQLVGHIGAGSDLLGTFADVASGRTFLARAGQTLAKPGIRVRTLQRVRRPQKSGAGNRVHGWVTVAEIEDLLTGEAATLTDDSRKEIEVTR